MQRHLYGHVLSCHLAFPSLSLTKLVLLAYPSMAISNEPNFSARQSVQVWSHKTGHEWTRPNTTTSSHRGSPRSTDLRGDEHAAGGTNGDGRISRGISLVRTKEVLWILNGALGLAVTARHKDVLWRSALQTDLGHEGLRHDLGITSKYIKISMDQLQNQQPAAWNDVKCIEKCQMVQDISRFIRP